MWLLRYTRYCICDTDTPCRTLVHIHTVLEGQQHVCCIQGSNGLENSYWPIPKVVCSTEARFLRAKHAYFHITVHAVQSARRDHVLLITQKSITHAEVTMIFKLLAPVRGRERWWGGGVKGNCWLGSGHWEGVKLMCSEENGDSVSSYLSYNAHTSRCRILPLSHSGGEGWNICSCFGCAPSSHTEEWWW